MVIRRPRLLDPSMASIQPNLDAVTTINADGSRKFIHPADVSGPFTSWRAVVGFVLLAIYIALPWIQINGNPAVFLHIAERQLHLFGITLAPQDYWLGFFMITGAGFLLFFVTALLGRIWCGWACPQTVFLDLVRRVERLIEGDATSRRALDAAPWTPDKIAKRVLKHTIFGVFAFILAHVFLSYFVSLPVLYQMVQGAPAAHWSAFVFVFLMAGALMINFSWFREQFCIILCPYGRLQSALIDDDSIVIGYDAKRGDPRGKRDTVGAGDCIDCLRCVQVCPTGIDIRQGLQMECIACSACIDACDKIMTKLGRKKGLVRYDSLKGLGGGRTRWIRPRIILYTVLLLLGAGVMSFSLAGFQLATASMQRMPGPPYYLENGQVRNQFHLRLINKQNKIVTFKIRLSNTDHGVHLLGNEQKLSLAPLSEQFTPVVVVGPPSTSSDRILLSFDITATNGSVTLRKSVPFLRP